MINLSNGIDETISKMASVNCVFEKSFNDKNWMAPQGYSALLEIQSPPSCGQIRFHFSHIALAMLNKKNMREEAATPDRSQVLDCLAEISNVSYGLTKVKLNQEGSAFNMSRPLADETDDLPSSPSSPSNKTIIPFKIYGEICYIEVFIL